MLTVSLLMCALVALSRADGEEAAAPSCAEGWKPYDKYCFHYFEEKLSWADAEMNCQKNNGNLATIHNIGEEQFIHGLVPDDAAGIGMWVGASNCQQDDSWLWKDGSSSEFTYWCPTEPNNLGGNQHCLQAALGDAKCWNDLECNVPLPSVCRTNL